MEQKKTKSYVNAKIYRIVCNVTELQYIGSTCKTLSARLSCHKSVFKKFLKGKQVKIKYITSFEVLKHDNFDIILIEKLENCKSKDELKQRERYFIESMVCCNKNIPCRTKEEWYKANPDYNKNYYIENPDYFKNYKIENKEKIKIYQDKYQENYRIDNQEKINKKINCICGGKYIYFNKAHHFKTHKHIKYCSLIENSVINENEIVNA